jgi:hypothetical protein
MPTHKRPVNAEIAALYNSLPRTVVRVEHVQTEAARFHVRHREPWTPANGARYDVELDSLKPPQRSLMWIACNWWAYRLERDVWQRLQAHDRDERARASTVASMPSTSGLVSPL